MNKITRPHEKLDVWQAGVDLSIETYNATKKFPKEETFGLVSQMRRAAVSIPANIAEGASRQSKKEFIKFLYIARGSLSELETHAAIAEKLGYLDDTCYTNIIIKTNNIGKMLTGLIKALKAGITVSR